MIRIGVIGQGYVGLPLAVEFAHQFSVVGFDINCTRVNELNEGRDSTLESDIGKLNHVLELGRNYKSKIGYKASSEILDLIDVNVYIITVPTPIDRFNAPNLSYLLSASETVGKVLKAGDTVIYESTVYPGCTEEECIPVLEQFSGLKLNENFHVGYSPERIVPGDKVNTLTNIKKITSGSNIKAADFVDELYNKIIKVGTFKAKSIKVAEASKAIENAQRDVNISFVNELSLIFDRLGIDTLDVLEAASTKFNFLKFRPGLVGGHCISVDPYYLAYKAVQSGYHPNVILSGRRVNDSMPSFIASKTIKLLLKNRIDVIGAKVLILGFTFKENCPDVRNSKVYEVYKELIEYDLNVSIFDPWVDLDDIKREYNLNMLKSLSNSVKYDAIIIAVAHKEFLSLDYKAIQSEKSVLFDLKGILDSNEVDARL